MISIILIGFIKIVIYLCTLLLTPIQDIIDANFPDLNTAFTTLGNVFNYLAMFFNWFVSALGIPPAICTLLGIFWGFKLTVPLLVYVVKLALKWYRKLMP